MEKKKKTHKTVLKTSVQKAVNKKKQNKNTGHSMCVTLWKNYWKVLAMNEQKFK